MIASQDFAAVDHLLSVAVADGVAPGFVAMVADASGVLHASADGVRTIGSTTPITADTKFWIASMPKLVTAIGVMQFVEAGDLALDEPVGALVPELAHPRVLTGINAVGRAVTRPARGAIALHQLLTHTSGIGYESMNMELLRGRGPGGPPPPRPVRRWRVRWRQTGCRLDLGLRDRLGRHDYRAAIGDVARPLFRGAHLRPARDA